MRYVQLGRTGLSTSEIGFGAWAIGGNQYGNSYGHTDDVTSKAAVHAALECGINFFDTADVYGYGHSEEVLGAALKDATFGLPPIIATKVGGNFYQGQTRMDFSPDYIRFAVDQSLRRLQVDRIDLYQLHNPSAEIIAAGAVLDTLEDLQAAGKIGHIGVSVFTPDEAMACLADDRIAAIQLVYNLLRREMESQVLETAQLRHVAIIAREPLANGFLAGRRSPQDEFEPGDIRYSMPAGYKSQLAGAAAYVREVLEAIDGPQGVRTLAQVALQFVIRHPAVSVVIPGAKKASQVIENAHVSDLGPLEGAFITSLFGPDYQQADPAQKPYQELPIA